LPGRTFAFIEFDAPLYWLANASSGQLIKLRKKAGWWEIVCFFCSRWA